LFWYGCWNVMDWYTEVAPPGSFSVCAWKGGLAVPLLLLPAAAPPPPPNVKPPPVVDAPKPVFVLVFVAVLVLNGLLVGFEAPKPPPVLPAPNSDPPVFEAPKPVDAGLFCPKRPGKLLESCFIPFEGAFIVPPPVLLVPNPPPVLAVFPNPPPLPNPPDVAVLPPKSPPPVLVVFDAPKEGLLAPNGELLFWFEPNAPKPPDVAVLPPNNEPPVDASVFEPNLLVFELPKPPKVLVLLLLLPKPKDMVAVAKVECVESRSRKMLRDRGLERGRRQRAL
jgi:hypothetical protein